MNESMSHAVPMDAISKGRDYEAVLTEYKRIWEGAKEAATAPGKSDDDIFAHTMMAAAYRIYLLGVEDGMKEAKK